jgi:hypothetical protein
LFCLTVSPFSHKSWWRRGALSTLFAYAIALAGCGSHNLAKPGEVAYVAAPQVTLRDRVATVFNKVGTVDNGEKVTVLERTKNGRFVRVRGPHGEEGWVEQRYLADQKVFDRFQVLQEGYANATVQARATTRSDLNMHATPGRETEHLYQLKEGEKVDLLKRATAERAVKGASKPASDATPLPPPVIEDWWLARSSQKHYGWLLARMVDIDVPVDVAQYAEGQRIIADFVLNQVEDNGKLVPEYLLLLNEAKDGSPVDFDQIRVFTWNKRAHHYETAYRERNLSGVLPAQAGQENFGADGTLPVFTIRIRNDSGGINERKYRLKGVLVKRVLGPGEEPPKPVRRRRK